MKKRKLLTFPSRTAIRPAVLHKFVKSAPVNPALSSASLSIFILQILLGDKLKIFN